MCHDSLRQPPAHPAWPPTLKEQPISGPVWMSSSLHFGHDILLWVPWLSPTIEAHTYFLLPTDSFRTELLGKRKGKSIKIFKLFK